MSLFKTRSFWSYRSDDEEYFDQNSMIITCLNGDSDYIITGSQSGVLRIFKPSCTIEDNEISGLLPTDLVIEKIFDKPILQLGYGRLVSGSLNYQTAILSPRRVSVHLLKIKEGQTEHGTQNTFELLYEHHLPRSAVNFTVGQFGGSQNRDFICVQSLDGVLSFFEQENPTFCCFLPDFLLPSPVAYVKKTDSFVTGTDNWQLVSYRYNSLSETGDVNESGKNSKTKIFPTWSYFLGEPIIDIAVREDPVNKIASIVVLGERNLFCLFDSGRLNFMKKLEYSPICFEVYIINEKIFCLIVSETNNLLIYENTTLKWCAKLQYLPVCIKRAFLRTVKGALVLLSEDGALDCCYLGTEPSLFVAPPLTERETDIEKIEEELGKLTEQIKQTYGNDLKFANQNNEKEITIKIQINQDLVRCKYETNLIDSTNAKMCVLHIDVVPRMAFEEVQVTVATLKPLKIHPNNQFFVNPEETMSIECHAYLNEDMEVPSLNFNVIVTVISSLGVPRSFCKYSVLPLKLVAESCAVQKEGEHKIILNVNQNIVPLLTLFPEFVEDIKVTSSIAFKNTSSGEPVTILVAKSSDRYRIQSNSFLALSYVIEQMILRLHKHYTNVEDFRITYSSALPTTETVFIIREHFSKREQSSRLELCLDQLGGQFRTIQKRLISKFKVKNPTPLTNLEILMDDTYLEIISTIEKLTEANKELVKSQIKLSCALNLIGNLIKIMNIEENLKENLVSVFCPTVDDLESQNWEDVMDATLGYLLRTYLAKSEKDKLRLSQTNIEKVTDISKVEKHLVQVLERISKIEKIDTEQKDVSVEIEEENKKMEKEEEEPPVGNQFGVASMRLLSARKSLLRKRHKDKEEEEDK
ncbi:protein PTHB1 isoform X1 [Diorhabda carinulata]|uniref:protein PTHB1 isoform X1 n=1 Tax=Diorhabda carinulata TaxID=1163345 RepID=UPI0025A2E9E4|nr:protein PTHB1 isoform X1 [Diorhabda carinulata]